MKDKIIFERVQKLQVVGGCSNSVIIPKEWVYSCNLGEYIKLALVQGKKGKYVKIMNYYDNDNSTIEKGENGSKDKKE